jgi:hydrogenase assembly chaperone HypC/HupF
MCLGIPGRVISIDTEQQDLANVEVAGASRKINLGILEQRPRLGEWVLIQSGFAIALIDEETALTQLRLLAQYTGDAMVDDSEFDWENMELSGGRQSTTSESDE